VRDYRVGQIAELPNVELFRESRMSADDALAVGADHILVATGSHWRHDGRGRNSQVPLALENTMTPEEVMSGANVVGPAIVYDEDQYYVGSALAEHLAARGLSVIYVTDAGVVSAWSSYTAEQSRAHARLQEMNVSLRFNAILRSSSGSEACFADVFSGEETRLPCGTLIPITSREPDDALWQLLRHHAHVLRIGDARAPGIIAQAVYDGHEAARAIAADAADMHFRRERVVI
jgi:dimethylamine/trimethylamine dehydrogenase